MKALRMAAAVPARDDVIDQRIQTPLRLPIHSARPPCSRSRLNEAGGARGDVRRRNDGVRQRVQ